MPNESILLDTLPLQEAKDSSAIENIITTHDELFNEELQSGYSQAAKEVQRYATALRLGTRLVQQYGFLSANHVLQIQEALMHNNRWLPAAARHYPQKPARGDYLHAPAGPGRYSGPDG